MPNFVDSEPIVRALKEEVAYLKYERDMWKHRFLSLDKRATTYLMSPDENPGTIICRDISPSITLPLLAEAKACFNAANFNWHIEALAGNPKKIHYGYYTSQEAWEDEDLAGLVSALHNKLVDTLAREILEKRRPRKKS